jgi:glycosyltransferase involved in cell wall biosynthesis
VRICVVYDCLFPYTVGGAERWCRNLAERFARDGHDVTYLTLRQWPSGERPDVPGVRIVAVGPKMPLYAGGRRRILPPLVFGLGVLAHLLARGRRYDVVHTASFPYFSLVAAAAARTLHRFRLVVDWHEVWTREYWREYLGRSGGAVGWAVQRLCLRVRQDAFCFSRLHERRLHEQGVRGNVTLLEGEYAGPLEPPVSSSSEPVVVFAGRHIPEKCVPALIPAVVRAREEIPELRCEIYGDGPERAQVLRLIREQGLQGIIEAPGFVESERIEAALTKSMCLALPSRREGYGLIVIEAAARGTPSVVVRHPDNAATELVDEGSNGVIAASGSPEDLAAAFVRVHRAGPALRRSTAEWFERNRVRLSLSRSIDLVAAKYARP